MHYHLYWSIFLKLIICYSKIALLYWDFNSYLYSLFAILLDGKRFWRIIEFDIGEAKQRDIWSSC